MYNDVSLVDFDSATCAYIPRVDELSVVDATTTETYVLQGNTYYSSRVDNTTDITTHTCLDSNYIQSNFDFAMPTYYALAFAGFIFILALVYTIVLRPWFRSKV